MTYKLPPPDLVFQLLSAANYIDSLGGSSKAYRAALEQQRQIEAQGVPEGWNPTNDELTAIYKKANGEDTGKAQPLTTQRIFKAMRAMLASATPAPQKGKT